MRITGESVSFAYWALLCLPFALLNTFIAIELILALFLTREERSTRLAPIESKTAATTVWNQPTIWIMALVLIGWFTAPWHGINETLIAVIGALLITMPPFRGDRVEGSPQGGRLELARVPGRNQLSGAGDGQDGPLPISCFTVRSATSTTSGCRPLLIFGFVCAHEHGAASHRPISPHGPGCRADPAGAVAGGGSAVECDGDDAGDCGRDRTVPDTHGQWPSR